MIVKTILQMKERGAGIVTISPAASVADAAKALAHHRIGAVVVVDGGGAVVGILSERDIVRDVAQRGGACLDGTVRDLMTADVQVCHESDSLHDLMEVMTSHRIRHLPVVDVSRTLVGIVTIGDVVKARLAQADMDVEDLRQYVVAAH
jgi:CBS domain-containing protein